MKKLTTLCLLLGLLLGLGGCGVGPVGKDTITVTALMADSAGLFVGNDVGVLGVKVGKVTSIEPEGDHVRVRMSVDAGQPVPADAGAVVVARSVATDRYVELTPVYHQGPRMKDGTVIQQPQTRTPVDFDDVLAALNTFATGIGGSAESRNAIKDLLRSGSTALAGTGADANKAITSLGAAVDRVAGQRQNITTTVRSLDTLTSTIAANQQVVRQFVTQVSQASQMLAAERLNFQAALRALTRAVTLVADFAHQNRQQFVRSLDQSTALMQSLMTKKATLSEVLRVMPLALQNLRALDHDGRLLVKVDPTVLTPIGGLVNSLCSSTPVDICTELGPSLLNLQNLLALLGLNP